MSLRFQWLRALAFAGVGLLASDLGAEPAQLGPPPIPKLTPDAVTHHTLAARRAKSRLRRARRARSRCATVTTGRPPRVLHGLHARRCRSAHRPVTFSITAVPAARRFGCEWDRSVRFACRRRMRRPRPGPPYRLVDNRYSLLDKTDLVFIDMPGSGYGRIIGAGTTKDFWGVDQDADAFAQFIRAT